MATEKHLLQGEQRRLVSFSISPCEAQTANFTMHEQYDRSNKTVGIVDMACHLFIKRVPDQIWLGMCSFCFYLLNFL